MDELLEPLRSWWIQDTWIVAASALSAMACALPGCFLVLRRQSLLGDALSHAVLPGIVGAYLAAHAAQVAGWIGPAQVEAWRQPVLFGGAMLVGVLCAWGTEWVRDPGELDGTAALGVVFTTLFAAGLLAIRLFADDVHLDPDCVLYGNLEAVYDGAPGIPGPVIVQGAVLAVEALLALAFFKELRITSFDPETAGTLGIPERAVAYGLMAVTAAALVAAFQSVGSILAIAMLIVPAATARLLTDRLASMVAVALAVAAGSAVLGHASALTVPPWLFAKFGWSQVRDAGTAGTTAVAAGGLFVAAALFAPRQGLLVRGLSRARLAVRIASEDVLGTLFRREETHESGAPETIAVSVVGPWRRLALVRLRLRGQIGRVAGTWRLTPAGRTRASELVRSHRLWEAYLAKHFPLADERLHSAAHLVEHFLDPATRAEIEQELDRPSHDPHGRKIPAEDGASVRDSRSA